MMGARWVNLRMAPELPVPSTMPVRPYSSTLRVLITVPRACAVALTRAFHLTSRVIPGGMSSRQVRRVLPPPTTLPGVAAAHPDGVIVHPEQGSSNPMLGPHGSRSDGTV